MPKHMSPSFFRWGQLALTLSILFPFGNAAAQIVIGQTVGITGPVAGSSKEATDGAKLYLDAVNSRGGVNGQQVQLVSLDDKFNPKLAVENARKLIVENNVVALFLMRGTPHVEAVMPLLAQYKVPLVAPSTGAMVLHQPVNPFIFNVRATYQREAENVVKHLGTIGLTRIAVVRVDDSFGADAVVGVNRGFAALQLKPVADQKYNRAKPDFSGIAPEVMRANAQAVIFIGSGQAIADGMHAVRAAGSKAQLVTLSNNAAGSFVKLLGAEARGTVVSQVFPDERTLKVAVGREASDLARAKGLAGITPAMMEGFSAAKVMVEGLRRAGTNPTRERLLAALNSMHPYDLGGLRIDFSATDHTGLDFVDLSIIGADGGFKR
jgi:branched-chain amino acid transport system substrate-binding protein